MSQPLLIDNILFAKRNERLTGVLPLMDCQRLSALLASQYLMGVSKHKVSDEDIIEFTLLGETNAVGQHLLHLTMAANLTTLCQRCLELMPLALSLKFDYLIAHQGLDDLQAGDIEDNDDFDLQEANQSMDLQALIEDEVMMALPIAPVHALPCADVSMQSGEKPNPFAALKGLLKK